MSAPTTDDRTTTPSRRAELTGGIRAVAPWLLGVAPFGLVIGVSAARADVPIVASFLTAPLIFGGSAQIAAIGLLSAGAAPAVVVLAVLAINLRLVLYSATMAPHWRGRPRRWQALAAYLLVDPSVAVGVEGYERYGDGPRGHRHYIAGAITLYIAWLAAITIGATVGARLPEGLHLEMVIPLFLAGEVAHRLRDRPTTAAATMAAVAAIVATRAPLHLGPMLAIAAGISAGMLVDRPRPPALPANCAGACP